MSSPLFHLNYAEFYITNVCNLNCKNCNRFNNFNFTGHQHWNDYADLYHRWSKKVSIKWLAVLGGEPTLNPTFIDWIKGLLELWPEAEISVISNGTNLTRYPEFYKILQDNQSRMFLEITIHGQDWKSQIYKNIQEFVQGDIRKVYESKFVPLAQWTHSYNAIKDSSWPECNFPEDFSLLPQDIQDECNNYHDLGRQSWYDSNGVRILVINSDSFYPSSIRHTIGTQHVTLHNSNPDQAVEVCYSKYCHHFSKGQLSKCGIAGILPEFIDQFDVDISDADRRLIKSYRPASPDLSTKELGEFLENLYSGQSIDQCKFCPDQLTATKFQAETKKIKLHKLNN